MFLIQQVNRLAPAFYSQAAPDATFAFALHPAASQPAAVLPKTPGSSSFDLPGARVVVY